MRGGKKAFGDVPLPPVAKSTSGWSFKSGKTFSFGGQKKPLPTVPSEPAESENEFANDAGSRVASTSTTSTSSMPKKLTHQEFDLDLGGDFGNMFQGSGYDKRASVVTLRRQQQQQQQQQASAADDRQALAPRSLTGNRLNQPATQIDRTAQGEGSPYSWHSQHSGDQLVTASPVQSQTNENDPPPVPKHGSQLPFRMGRANTDTNFKRSSGIFGRRRSTEPAEGEDEDAQLLKQSIAASKFLANPPPKSPVPSSSCRYRRNEDTFGPSSRQVSAESRAPHAGRHDDDNLFDSSIAHSSRMAQRFLSRRPSLPRNKVMTPAQFEKYRKDKERQDSTSEAKKDDSDSDDDVNYEDEEDEIEKSKQLAKQRRKQEANMAVYRQQMMKVTGESNPRCSLPGSISTPNLTLSVAPAAPSGPSENSDEDEEVPLAILAAHGFPNKNRPPNRLSTMMSNPNLRASVLGPSIQRPESAADSNNRGGAGGKLPPFARRLPQDPYGLVNNQVRESINLSGGSPSITVSGGSPAPANVGPGPAGGAPAPMGGGAAPMGGAPAPLGGLVGVIANEERSRAMRRGSPKMDTQGQMQQGGLLNGGGQDPLTGIPPQTMYPQQPMMTPGEMQMSQQMQQMQQFMQMQMQFMNMMAGQQNAAAAGGLHPNGHLTSSSMGDLQRRSFPDNGFEPVRGDAAMRTMSMVHPSSSSSYGQPMGGGTPSIHIQGQYAASIAPSERSNVGLPGRYRPVSQLSSPDPTVHRRAPTMSAALGGAGSGNGGLAAPKPTSKPTSEDEEDDEKGWEQMKAKRDKKRGLWKSKKTVGAELEALIS